MTWKVPKEFDSLAPYTSIQKHLKFLRDLKKDLKRHPRSKDPKKPATRRRGKKKS
jgi:hypothetical protein|tara:strand:- start:518 stop:682 length:165 start_codon:yes stop_codon:yes gene_type:complete